MRLTLVALCLLGVVAVAAATSKASTPAKFGKFGFRSERDALMKKHYKNMKHEAKHKKKAKAEECEVTVLMMDSYGDGWNGGKVSVQVNGADVDDMKELTLENGKVGRTKMTVKDGDVISFDYTEGQYPEENEFHVILNGNLLFAEGHSGLPPKPKVSVPFPIDCSSVAAGSQQVSDECPFRVRKEWNDMTEDEQKLYIKAVRTLQSSGAFQAFTSKHKENDNKAFAHGTSGFLPWHRQFLWDYESSLRALGDEFACVTLPYWDWSIYAGDISKSPIFAPDHFGPCNNGPVTKGIAKDFGITRDCDPTLSIPDMAGIFDIVKANKGYHRFRRMTERNAHNMVHVAVGGDMGSMGSPADPIFFSHHNFVDRIWALWQDCHDYDLTTNKDLKDGDMYAGRGQAPIDDPMTGHATTPRHTHSIVSMGYRFAGDKIFVEASWADLCNPTANKEGSEWAFFHNLDAETETETPAEQTSTETETPTEQATTSELEEVKQEAEEAKNEAKEAVEQAEEAKNEAQEAQETAENVEQEVAQEEGSLLETAMALHKHGLTAKGRLHSRRSHAMRAQLNKARRLLRAKSHRGNSLPQECLDTLKEEEKAFDEMKQKGGDDDACLCAAWKKGQTCEWIDMATSKDERIVKFCQEFNQENDFKEGGDECDLGKHCDSVIAAQE